MRRKKQRRLSSAACLLLQAGMFPIFTCLAAIFCSVSGEAELTAAEIHHYGQMLEITLASLVLLSVGALTAESVSREHT